MLRLAVEKQPELIVDDCELRRGGTSYTIETVQQLRERYPADDLFWVIGADQVGRLTEWRQIDELVRLVEFVYVNRPGYPVESIPGIPGDWLKSVPPKSVDV
jgi:nicotinate-nucleotide adenylyltransferase